MSILPNSSAATAQAGIFQQAWGKTKNGEALSLFTLRNANGVEARITNYGGTITHFLAPDRDGNLADVVLGFNSIEGYEACTAYFGCIIGRYGNRIAKGQFSLNGKTYTLATNNTPNHLHGGLRGFDKVVWTANPIDGPEPRLELKYLSRDGEEGYPGNLEVLAVYTLTKDNALRLEMTATSDADTIVNLTQHSYFNLSGKGTILDHEIQIEADHFTPTDATAIPYGDLRPVAGSAMDFRQARPVGERIDADEEQTRFGLGYDHNWVLNQKTPGTLVLAAIVHDPKTGRVLEVETTEPGVQFYTGNFLNGSLQGKDGSPIVRRAALCLEPQHFPDSPNKPQFPSTVLKAGETYHNVISYRLTVRR